MAEGVTVCTCGGLRLELNFFISRRWLDRETYALYFGGAPFPFVALAVWSGRCRCPA